MSSRARHGTQGERSRLSPKPWFAVGFGLPWDSLHRAKKNGYLGLDRRNQLAVLEIGLDGPADFVLLGDAELGEEAVLVEIGPVLDRVAPFDALDLVVDRAEELFEMAHDRQLAGVYHLVDQDRGLFGVAQLPEAIVEHH